MGVPHTIQTQVSLAPYTTLGIGGAADYMAHVHTLDELREAVRFAHAEGHPIFVLAGGSNVLVPDEGVRGLVLRPLFTSITYEIDGDRALVTAGSGVILDTLIEELVQRGYWGLENLSAIPGTVGGVPIQNVGAYGIEAKDVVVSVEAYDPERDTIVTLSARDCAFAYRDSYFKHAGKHLIITSVTFCVTQQPSPQLSYKDLAQRFRGDSAPTLPVIRTAVTEIRSKKFPDWHIMGTAGSFFKNPIIPRAQYHALQEQYPELVGFDVGNEQIKVSLGWILDHICGLRGYTEGSVGLFREQALVLVCTREACATEVIDFSNRIIERVYEATGIRVEHEVTMFA